MQVDWRTALTYVMREPGWKVRLATGGALMLLMPPIGWVLALGYRSIVGNRLVDARGPLLPDWPRHLAISLLRGAASLGVILSFLSPFLIAYWILGMRDLAELPNHWRELLIFAVAVIVFPPLALPAMPFLYAFRYDWLHFTVGDVAILLVLFFGGLFITPAGFLQVARYRSFRAAFKLRAAVRLIAEVPRLYVEAWAVSLAISAVAVLILPLAPWLLFWSYLSISHMFLQALAAARTAEGRASLPQQGTYTSVLD